MKIRIKGNTVRYRLSRSEIVALADSGRLEEKTEFPESSLTYAIEKSQLPELTAQFADNAITLFVPATALQAWAGSDQVGIENNIKLANGNSLHLLLEKDFKCIDVSIQEDQSDYFENPLLTC